VARAGLLLRDNLLNRGQIEKAYRRAIGLARHEIVIANAYFLPGRKLRQALIHAAQRGVRVRLLLQGRYEYFMQYHAARPVYRQLLEAGVEIYEYSESFLHAKVAVIDASHERPWATVGSSNLDPFSLLLGSQCGGCRCLLCQTLEGGPRAGHDLEKPPNHAPDLASTLSISKRHGLGCIWFNALCNLADRPPILTWGCAVLAHARML
jgi:hypothetical protein